MTAAARAWRSTTLRGKTFVAVGLATVLAGWTIGERQIVRVGLLLVVLPLVAAALLVRARRRLRASAVLSANRVEAGRAVTVRVTVQATGRLAAGPVGIHVDAPEGVRGGGALVVATPSAGGRAVAEVRLEPVVRGRRTVPPVRVEMRDALGLCRLERAMTEALPLTVLPRTEVLHGGLPATGTVTRGAGGSRATGIAGDADTTVREYRSGDDRRRVHWRSSARLGELMVRGEEQQRQSAVTVLLDTRAGAHRHTGAAGTFEWAVVAVASVTRHVLLAGHEVRLVGPPGADRADRSAQPAGRTTAARTAVELERLVDVRCSGERRNRTHPVAAVLPPPDASVLVAVLGAVVEADLPALRQARTGRPDALAILLDTDAWDLGSGQDPRSARGRADRSAALLRRAGWRVVVVDRGTSVASAWTGLVTAGGHRASSPGGVAGAARAGAARAGGAPAWSAPVPAAGHSRDAGHAQVAGPGRDAGGWDVGTGSGAVRGSRSAGASTWTGGR